MSISGEEGQDQTLSENTPLVSRSQKTEPVELVIFLRDRSGIHFHLEDGMNARADELLELVIEEQGLTPVAMEVFSLWFVSPILEVRLKGHHQPFQIIQQWDQLCAIYTDAKCSEINNSEPVLMLQRDVFYPKDQEVYVTNEQMLCLLYHEAKFNVIEGRYVLYSEDYHRLAGLQALIHLGKFNKQVCLLPEYRNILMQFYPEHMYSKENFALFSSSKGNTKNCEELFMEAHRKISDEYAELDVEKSLSILYRKYLEVCWSYPFYGSTFFYGQIETPTSRIKKLILPPPDTNIWVAINTDCVSIINRDRFELLLSIPFRQLSWEFQDPEFDGDNDPPPCLFLQFLVVRPKSTKSKESFTDDEQVTKLLKVYSREAKLMDALINTCVRRKRSQMQRSPGMDFPDSSLFEDISSQKILNRLEQLCLSTYSKDGESLD